MNKKLIFIVAITIIFSSIVVGCTTSNNNDGVGDNGTDIIDEEIATLEEKNEILESDNETLNTEIEKLKEENDELQQLNSTGPNPNKSLLQISLEVMDLVKDKNMSDLSNYVHPNKGLRFTPYFYVDTGSDQVFNTQQVSNLSQDTNVYNWGNFDGTGDPIDFDFNDYYDRFIYDEDYISPHIIGNNTAIGTGNITDNVAIAYPDGKFVEFHFTGFDSQYSGMDWRSLRLVFEEHAGTWYLVGIVHGEWTI